MVKKNASAIAAIIRREIGEGKFRQFERLPASRNLAENFGVARNTLRNALYQLEKEGLLEIRPGSGAYVVAADSEGIPLAVEEAVPLELIDARLALEPHICRLCVLHGRRGDFEKLGKLCAAMETATENPARFAEVDAAFHQALAAATRNNLLIWIMDQINTIRSLNEWTRMRHLTLNAQIITQYNQQHQDVLDALMAREPERAAQKMKEHLATARVSLRRAAEV